MKMNTIPLIVLLLTLLACGEKPLGPAGGNGSTPSTPATPAASEKVGEPLSAWQEGQMDIHFINTTTGECVFVIAPDGTQILIDAAGSLVSTGQVNSSVTNTGIRARWDPTKDPDYRTGKFIAGYLAKCMAWTGNDKIDYVVNTHFHNDHFGGYSKSLPVSDKSDTYRKQSLPEILDTYPVGTLLDRGWPDYMYPYDVRKLASNGDAIDNYVKAVQWHAAHTGLKAARFVAGSKDQVVLKRKAAAYPSFVFRNIAVNGEIWDGGQTTTATATFPAASEIQVANPADPGNADKCPAENHCSCVMKISYGAFDFFEGGDAQYNGMSSFPWKEILLAIYIFGGVATLTLYLVSAWKTGRLIRKGEQTKRDGFRLVLLEEDIPSFSWGRTVVIGLNDLKENPAIFTHELMHVKCRHSLDLIFFLDDRDPIPS